MMPTYGFRTPRTGTALTKSLAGYSGPAAYANAQPRSYGGAAQTSPSAFFGGNPFGLQSGASAPAAPPVKAAPRPSPYTAPAGGLATPQQGPQALAQPPSTAAPGVSYDYNADPILQQIQALSTQQRGDAQSGALSLRKQLAIDYGDTDYARSVLGDENTATAAAGNPNSVRAQLLKSYQTGQGSLDEALNKSNLFYGGERIKQQGQLTQNYQGQLAGATGQEQQQLGNIQSNYLAAMLAADQRDEQARQEAAARALQAALAQAMLAGGGGGGDYGGGGGGGDTGDGAPTPPANSLNLGYQVLGVPFGPTAPPTRRQRLRSTPLAQLL